MGVRLAAEPRPGRDFAPRSREAGWQGGREAGRQGGRVAGRQGGRYMIYDHFINPRASLGPRELAHLKFPLLGRVVKHHHSAEVFRLG